MSAANLSDTVWSFMDRACDLYGKVKAQHFAQEMHADCLERGMQSPIEYLFWIAAMTIFQAHDPLGVGGL